MRLILGQRPIDRFDTLEEKYDEVVRVLAACGGNIEAAAAEIGCLNSTVREIALHRKRSDASKARSPEAHP